MDADTLEIEARMTPAAAPARVGRDGAPADGGLYAVYGVGVDDVHDTVWVTQSRQNTVAVYRQSDLSLVRQFDPGTVNHARDVVVDPALNKAYASATFEPEVVVFDTARPEVASARWVAPDYLRDDQSGNSPWAAQWDRSDLGSLHRRLMRRPHPLHRS